MDRILLAKSNCCVVLTSSEGPRSDIAGPIQDFSNKPGGHLQTDNEHCATGWASCRGGACLPVEEEEEERKGIWSYGGSGCSCILSFLMARGLSAEPNGKPREKQRSQRIGS